MWRALKPFLLSADHPWPSATLGRHVGRTPYYVFVLFKTPRPGFFWHRITQDWRPVHFLHTPAASPPSDARAEDVSGSGRSGQIRIESHPSKVSHEVYCIGCVSTVDWGKSRRFIDINSETLPRKRTLCESGKGNPGHIHWVGLILWEKVAGMNTPIRLY